MRKSLVLSSQVVLLTGAISLGTISLSSCSVEVWRSNIQMVISPAGSKLADHAFNQNSFDGIVAFLKNVRYKEQKFIEPNPENNIEKIGGLWRCSSGSDAMRLFEIYRDTHASGANLIISTGFDQGIPLQQFTSNDPKMISQFPNWVKRLRNNLGFIYVDGSFDRKVCAPFNAVSVAYKSDQAGVIAGVLTGIVLNIDNYYKPVKVDFNERKYKELEEKLATGTSEWYSGKVFKIGGYVGLPSQATLTFLNGWIQGANYFNEHCRELKKQVKDLIPDLVEREWYPLTFIEPDDQNYKDLIIDNFSAGSFSPTEPRAKNITNYYAQHGAAAILPVAGSQDPLVVSEIAQSKTHMAVIGTDVTIEDDDSVNQYVQHGDIRHSIIPFSITKNLTDSIASILEAVNIAMVTDNPEAMDHTNSYHGFGYNNWGTFANGGVGVSHGKIYYDANNGTKKVDQNTGSDSLCKKIVAVITTMMDDEYRYKSRTKVYYESLTGNEFDSNRVAVFASDNTKQVFSSVITAPKIGASTPGNNVYSVPSLDESKRPLTDLTQIKTFIHHLYEAIGRVKVNNKDVVNWYMKRR